MLLGRDATGTGVRDALVIVEDGPRDFGSEMARLSAEGAILSSLSGSNVDGRRLDRWTVAITSDGQVVLGITDQDGPLRTSLADLLSTLKFE
jgi:hypothetical protein